MNRPSSRTVAIMRKEFIQIARDPRTLAIALLMPVLMLFLYGYGLSMDIKEIRLGVVDWSRSQSSRELLRAFTQSGYFHWVYTSDRYGDLAHALDARWIKVGLVIPADFAKQLARGQPAPVQVLVDGSDPNTASVVTGYTEAIIRTYSSRVVLETLRRRVAERRDEENPAIGSRQSAIGENPQSVIRNPRSEILTSSRLRGVPPIDLRVRVWYNEELRSVNFFVPGVIVVILMVTAALLTSGTIARERERGTIEQLVASPLKARELMVGKIVAYVLLGFIDVALVVLVGWLWFGVPVKGSLLLLAVCSGLFLMNSLGIGLLISAAIPSQQAAMLAAMLLTTLPSVLLSGFVFPIASMPPIVQYLTYLVPARYFMVIVRGIFLKGAGVPELWDQIVPMTLFGLALLAASALSFKKRL